MSVATMNLDYASYSRMEFSTRTSEKSSSKTPSPVGENTSPSVATVMYQENVNMQLKNSDGDVFELSYEASALGRMEGFGVNGSEEEMEVKFQNFLNKIKDFVQQQEDRLLNILLNGSGALSNGLFSDSAKVNMSGKTEEIQVPEYWNAENTSQRIVDFATSFFQGEGGSEYGKMMIEAVKKGFEEANQILGDLPGGVGELASETQALTLQKLDQWVEANSTSQELV